MRHAIEPQCETLEEIRGISPYVLRAPHTGQDMHDGARLPLVPRTVIRYLAGSVGRCWWLNHLALAAVLMTARRYEPTSIYGSISVLNIRFRLIASSDYAPKRLRSMREWRWNLDTWLQKYFRGEICNDSPTTRNAFWSAYQRVSRIQERWLASLDQRVRSRYRPFVLPIANNLIIHPLVRYREVTEDQQQRRKEETDALMPLYPQLRAEAHLRFNQVARLRQAYREAVRQRSQSVSYPCDFSYEDGGRRFRCRIWDEASFLRFLPGKQRGQFRISIPKKFLELIAIEEVATGQTLSIDEQIWFAELLKQVLPYASSAGLPTSSREWLKSWGYAPSSLLATSCGLTYSPERAFFRKAQRLMAGLLIPVEELYQALTFGLLALDLITTNGPRLNEVMQVSFDPRCLVRLELPTPTGAADPRPRVRYVLRLLPKGERMSGVNYRFRRIASPKNVTRLPHAQCYRVSSVLRFRSLVLIRSAAKP